MVLKLHQLFGNIIGEKVAAGGEGLAEFDKDRPQFLQRLPDPNAPWQGFGGLRAAPAGGNQEPQGERQMGQRDQLIKTVLVENPVDMAEAPKVA